MGEPVFLCGEAAEIGRLQGQWQRRALRERVDRTLTRAAEGKLTVQLRERADRFGSVLAACAPGWLAEGMALCEAASIELWQLLALNALPPNFWGDHYRAAAYAAPAQLGELIDSYEAQGVEPGLGGGDCTTFFALGEASLSGETVFHKNRDERDEVQWLAIKQLRGEYRFVGGAEVGNLGTAHAHTENLWAGANNTGSEVPPDEYRDCALSDAHVLRLLCEKCGTLQDIVPALEEWQARGYVGGGGANRGSVWLFADSRCGLVIEATSCRLAYEWFEDDAMEVRTNHFILPAMAELALPAAPGSVLRLERAKRLWHEQKGVAGIAAAQEIGRDRAGAPTAICRNVSDQLGSVTVSTSTATISAHDDRRCQTHFRNCHPAYTPVVILCPIDAVTDSELLSGAHNQAWRAYRRDA